MAKLLLKVLENVVPADQISAARHRRSLYIAGDDSKMTISRADVPPLNMVPDPNTKLGPSFYIVDDGCDAMDGFIASANEDDIVKAKVGRKAVEEAVVTVVRKFRNGNKPKTKDLEVESRSVLTNLCALVKETQAVVPIENLVLSGLEEFTVGKVHFRPYSKVAPSIKQKLAQALSNKSNTQREATDQIYEEAVLPHYSNSPTCAEVILDAEQNRVTEMVNSEVDASLNLLRCYTHLLFSREARAFIGLKGAVLGNTRPCISFTEDNFYISLENVGMLMPYTVTPTVLEHLVQNYAFNELSAVLKKPELDRTQLERVIVTAIRWLGRSVNASGVPEQVLSLAIALERLMIPDNEQGGKADSLALRLAFLVSSNADERMSIYEQGKKLYRLRSDVVHDGKISVAIDDLQNLERYSCLALVKMAQHLTEWKTHNDFVYWAKKQTFS